MSTDFPMLYDLLKTTGAAEEAAPTSIVTEDDNDDDVNDLLDLFIDKEKIYSFDGPSGKGKFEKIAKAIGYSNIADFLDDNPGAIEAMVDWIRDQDISEWIESLRSNL